MNRQEEGASFREKLRSRRKLIGTVVSLPVPGVADCLGRCGYDWLWIDMEHAPLSLDQVQSLLIAKGHGCSGLVRVPTNEEPWIKRVLDLGADGIIVPQVKSVEEAERAVSAAKYPPVGVRSMGLGRCSAYGMDARYAETANDNVAVLLQIEHRDAVANLDAILAVEGIDAIIVGPYDLSGSFAKLGKVMDPEVQEAIGKVLAACKWKKIPVGIFAMVPEQAAKYFELGFDLVSVGIDIHMMWNAAKTSLEQVTKAAAHS